MLLRYLECKQVWIDLFRGRHMLSSGEASPRATNQNILEVVRTQRSSLRKSDGKVADLLLADPRRVLNATLAETADFAHVSQPTVIRFCVAVGCSGFSE